MNAETRPVGATRSWLPAAVGLGLMTIAGWAFGLDWALALLVAAGLVTVFGLRRLPTTATDDGWPPAPDAGTDRGVRREVSRLSWSLHGYESRVERPSLLRLRAVAERRLSRRGLSLDDPADDAACRTLLGPGPYRTVTAAAASARRSEVTFDEFAATLDTLERLQEERPR